MAKPSIDLSEFLSGAPKKKLPAVVLKPQFSSQHIICLQCKGTGKRLRRETHTPELTEEAEQKLESLGKVLPVQQVLEERIKCERCNGEGNHFLPDDVRAQEVTLFWTRSKCRCGATYDGPGHQNPCMIKNHVYRPIIHAGRLFGWRYRETTYTPGQVLPIHATLPMKVEYFEYHIEACRKCIRQSMVICLPHQEEQP